MLTNQKKMDTTTNVINEYDTTDILEKILEKAHAVEPDLIKRLQRLSQPTLSAALLQDLQDIDRSQQRNDRYQSQLNQHTFVTMQNDINLRNAWLNTNPNLDPTRTKHNRSAIVPIPPSRTLNIPPTIFSLS